MSRTVSRAPSLRWFGEKKDAARRSRPSSATCKRKSGRRWRLPLTPRLRASPIGRSKHEVDIKRKQMITVIDTNTRKSTPIPEGTVRHILTPSSDKTMVEVARYEMASGKTYRIPPSERTQVVYMMEGKDAEITFS